jgi:phosphoribosylformylglycinamidine cyclo-ligase
MRVLAEVGGFGLSALEDTWNMGIGMIAVVDQDQAYAVTEALRLSGHHVWVAGIISPAGEMAVHSPTTSAKGVEGGAVALVGAYRD